MKSRDVSVIEMLQLLAMEVYATGSSAEILEGCGLLAPELSGADLNRALIRLSGVASRLDGEKLKTLRKDAMEALRKAGEQRASEWVVKYTQPSTTAHFAGPALWPGEPLRG